MNKKLGFIGAGNMAEAIIGGVIGAELCRPADIMASDMNYERLFFIEAKYDVYTTEKNIDIAKRADIIFLSVKPQIYDEVIEEIKNCVKADAIIVILAAGLGTDTVRKKFGTDSSVQLIKVMPNTPAMVNRGMTAIYLSKNSSADSIDDVVKIFESVGKVEILHEKNFDAFTAIAASSPAYVFMFIEAMAEAGVQHGLSRKQAIRISTQAVLGSAKLLQESGKHPAELRDAVCSPCGTTIEAVCELERQGFRNAIISAVTACVKKYNELKE